MKPELNTAIAEANASEVERAREAVEKQAQDGFWSDTVQQFDALGQIADLGLAVANGVRVAGECVAAVCDAIPHID